MNIDEYIPVAKLGKAHGLKGEVRLFPYAGISVDFSSCLDVVLLLPAGESQEFTLAGIRVQAKYSIVSFHEVSNRDDAEHLTGAELLIPEDLLGRADEKNFWYEYKDAKVYTEDGKELGRVKRMFETGAHPIMVISGADQEYMIPVTPEIIVDVDLAAGKIVVSPPLGLLEINI